MRNLDPGAGIWWSQRRKRTEALGHWGPGWASPYSLGQGNIPRAEGDGFQLNNLNLGKTVVTLPQKEMGGHDPRDSVSLLGADLILP